jgi:mono/diheme cytochrome c family protein
LVRSDLTGAARAGSSRALRAGGLALALAALLAGCKPLDDTLAAVPIFAFMHNSPALGPYQAPRPEPPGAVPFASPIGIPAPPIENTVAAKVAFGETHPNPYPMTPESIERGRAYYDRYCGVCHGATGRGDGPLVGAGRFPFATDLTSAPVAQRTDGYLNAVIRVGGSLMPQYGDRVDESRRWWIVNYVRYLQQQAGTFAAARD